MGDFPAPPEYLDQMRREFGLDQPVWIQLLRYLGKVVQGDFGYSFANQQPVATLILERLGATLELTMTALAFASVLGIVFGVVAARSAARGSRAGRSAVQGRLVGGLFDSGFLARPVADPRVRDRLGWLPSQGNNPVRGTVPGFEGFVAAPVLPGAAGLRVVAALSHVDHAYHARRDAGGDERRLHPGLTSRGASEWTVVVVHALRNAAAPVLTVIGYNVGFVLAGLGVDRGRVRMARHRAAAL